MKNLLTLAGLFFTIHFVSANLPMEFSPQTIKMLRQQPLPDNNDCALTAEQYAQNQYIMPKCFDTYLKLSQSQHRDYSTDQKTLILAYKNILFIQAKIPNQFEVNKKKINRKSGLFIIAGEKTQLSEILSVSLSPDESEVAILNIENKQKSILIFPTYMNGNVKPIRVIKLDQPQFSADIIKFNKTTYEIYLLDSERKRIVVISSNANSNSINIADHLKPLKIIDIKDSIKNPSLFELTEESILLLDSAENKTYVLSKSCFSDKCDYSNFIDENSSNSCHVNE